MKAAYLLALFVGLTSVAFASSVEDTHIDEWKIFVRAKCKPGAKQAEIDAILVAVSFSQLYQHLGGTEHYRRYYAIDDYLQIVADFDRNKKLLRIPKIIPRTKWRRFPDGQGWVEVPGGNIDPVDGSVILP